MNYALLWRNTTTEYNNWTIEVGIILYYGGILQLNTIIGQ